MIEMFFAMTILLVIIGVAVLVILASPWWLIVIAFSAGILLLNKLVNPAPGAEPGELDD